MADQDRGRNDKRSASEKSKEQAALGKKQDNSEWLRDQTGEDHNLSGSSTYRTLPDQPEADGSAQGDRDAKKRQSKR